MNKNKVLIVLVIALLVINLLSLIVILRNQEQKAPQHGPPGEGPKRLIIAKLGLDEQQQNAYEVLIEDHREKSSKLRKKSQELHEQLFSLLSQNNRLDSASNALINQIAENQKTLDRVNFEHFVKIKQLCKGPQLEKFNALAGDLARLFGPPPHH